MKSKFGFSKVYQDINNQMAFANQLRGMDGVGMMYDKKLNIHTLKQPAPAHVFFTTKEFADAQNDIFNGSRFVIFHTRASTTGVLSNEHTHPFLEGGICLVHNGKLINHRGTLDHTTDHDSHSICLSLNRIGVKRTLSKIQGAFALVWYNVAEKKLYLCRNNDRPLHLIETEKAWVISSELKMAEWILDRNKEKIVKSISLDIEKLYSFSFDLSENTKEELPMYVSYTKESMFNNNYHWRGLPPPPPQTLPKKIKKPNNITTKGMYDVGEVVYSIPMSVDGKSPCIFVIGKLDKDYYMKVKIIGEDSNAVGKIYGTLDQLNAYTVQSMAKAEISHKYFHNNEIVYIFKIKEGTVEEVPIKDQFCCNCGRDAENEKTILEWGSYKDDLYCPDCKLTVGISSKIAGGCNA